MSKSIIKNVAESLGIKYMYSGIRRWKDDISCDRFECGIGDILLLRDVPSNNQLLLTSRLLDIEEYLSGRNKAFPWQNTISRAAYGEKHRETDGNRSFERLIESYLKDGYHPDSYITCDEEMNLMDGNHRMALHIYEKIERVNVRRVHRKVPFPYGGDWYFENGISTVFMDEIYKKYDAIQEWLIESGNTFCAYFKGEDTDDLTNVMKRLCKVLRIMNCADEGKLVQFSMASPQYSVNKGFLSSNRANEINSILNKRKNKNTLVEVSKNCMEGKNMFSKRLK